MSVRPSDVSRRPVRLDIADPRGDVLADVLGLGLLRNVLYKQVEARAPWGLEMSGRGRAMLYLIAQGEARLEVAGERARVLGAGDVALVPRDAAHVLRDAATTVPSAVCDGSRRATSATRRIGGRGALTSIVAAFLEPSRSPPTLLERRPEVVVLSREGAALEPQVARTIELVLGELASPGPASVVILQRLVDVLVVHAFRSMARGSACQAHARRQGLVALSDPPIHEALALMHAHVAHGWTVGELAARVGLSRSGFAARFSELVGEPPLQYLARWRVARAAELLRDTGDGVGEIAARVGYESVPSFSKAFKRWQGASPGAYRRAAAPA
jgi:AraC-like DNA-binding protein